MIFTGATVSLRCNPDTSHRRQQTQALDGERRIHCCCTPGAALGYLAFALFSSVQCDQSAGATVVPKQHNVGTSGCPMCRQERIAYGAAALTATPWAARDAG